MWPGLIAKAKEGGLDVIQTYVFWNGHEPSRGVVRFSNFIFRSSYCALMDRIFFWWSGEFLCYRNFQYATRRTGMFVRELKTVALLIDMVLVHVQSYVISIPRTVKSPHDRCIGTLEVESTWFHEHSDWWRIYLTWLVNSRVSNNIPCLQLTLTQSLE